MNITLELYKRGNPKDGLYPLIIRFTVNRKPIRYPTGIHFTEPQWLREQKTGYSRCQKAVELEEKAKIILEELTPFDLQEFKLRMTQPVVPKEAISKWWGNYILHRTERINQKSLSLRTFDIDKAVGKKVEKFLLVKPELNNIHVWRKDELQEFQFFMRTTEKLSEDTVKIYLEAYRTFFTWLRDEQEVISRSPFTKYKIQRGSTNWFPYSLKELFIILSVKPRTETEKSALRWVKTFLSFGGADPMDFSSMKWKQVQSEAIQMLRVKVKNSSKTGKKLVYLTHEISELFTELTSQRGNNDDYVLSVFDKEKTQRQNLENHKLFIRNINKFMRRMIDTYYKEKLEEDPFYKEPFIFFTIKRLRPTAATIALMSSGGDVDFVSKVLMHSNLTQTSVYLANLPNDEMKRNQEKYDEAIKTVMA